MNRVDFLSQAAIAAGTFAMSDPRAKTPAAWALPKASDLANWLAWSDVPGTSVALNLDGITHAAVAGVKLAGTSQTVETRTIFEAASLSKPIFAFAVLQLAKAGRLDLDRPLQSYLPSAYPIDDPRAAAITARHVLTHTTGLQNWRFHPDQKLKLGFTPGSRFSYSGEGFYFLQTVVERIVETGIAAFMKSTVLDRLRMNDSAYVWWPQAAGNLALPHDDGGHPSETRTKDLGTQLLAKAAASGRPLPQWTTAGIMQVLPSLDPPQSPLPVHAFPNVAATLLTTASDYARFLAAYREAEALGMFAPQIKVNAGISWGLGIGLDMQSGGMPFHWGDNEGYKNFFILDPARGCSVVAFSNGDRGLNLVERIAEETAGRRFAAPLWIE
jgi:CubicO group peptidase (beta-lactamase class C family)